MHTAIGSLRLRSRGAHCEGILAVEVHPESALLERINKKTLISIM